MGMYTELIFGAELKIDTPNEVIETLKYMIGEIKTKPTNFALPEDIWYGLLQGCSYSFAVDKPIYKMWKDDYANNWHISTRSSLKNHGDIREFLEWIKPYIKSGSGTREMYAIVMYEEAEEPTIYYLYDSTGGY